ncbi:MAG: chemotaxis protein CheW [Candidatus Nanohalobium sp.]
MADNEEEDQRFEEQKQIFVFELADEDYALNIERAKEVIKTEEKTINPVPNVPDFIEGITNIRGKVVPVLDLGPRFGLETSESKFIVVIELEDATAGVLVDDVKEVLNVNENKIKDAPSILEEEVHADYIEGVAVLEDRLIIILNLEEGLSQEEAMKISELRDELGDEEDDSEEEQLSEEEVREKAKERVKDS